MTLAQDIETALLAAGGTGATRATAAGAESWRRTARAVGRKLGRPISTHAYYGGRGFTVHASLTDFPQTPEEEKVREAQMRAAMESIAPRAFSLGV